MEAPPWLCHCHTVPMGPPEAGETRGARGGVSCNSCSAVHSVLNPSSYPPPANGDKSVPPFPLQEMIAQKLERIEVYI